MSPESISTPLRQLRVWYVGIQRQRTKQQTTFNCCAAGVFFPTDHLQLLWWWSFPLTPLQVKDVALVRTGGHFYLQ